MSGHPVFAMKFAKVYPMLIQKAERKGRTRDEVDQVTCWLTGYDRAQIEAFLAGEDNLEAFFGQAPAIGAHSALVTGVVCGVRVEAVEDPLMRRIRSLDKLVDELARGKQMEKILRA